MKLLGLTGGIGMGKSASAQLLQQRGALVLDTDDLAREVVEPGKPALAEIQESFGQAVIGADGRLKRDALAEIVFADRNARQRLEEILHPRIRDSWHAQVEMWRKQDKPLAVIVIPLLYETRAEKEFDAVVCLACTAATQRQRLAVRGWSAEQIQQRITAQWPVEQKMAQANYVIWTEGDLDVHGQQLDRIIR